MTAAERERIDRLRARVEQMLNELLRLREMTAASRAAVELDQQSVGRVSRMDALQAQQMALAADRQRDVQIQRIRRALDQIEKGEFGHCMECGNAIPDARLDAGPAAHLCVACASGKAR